MYKNDLRIGDLLISTGRNDRNYAGPFIFLGMSTDPNDDRWPYTFWDIAGQGNSWVWDDGDVSRYNRLNDTQSEEPGWMLDHIRRFTLDELKCIKMELVTGIDDRT